MKKECLLIAAGLLGFVLADAVPSPEDWDFHPPWNTLVEVDNAGASSGLVAVTSVASGVR